jgi:hypothetical protein
MNQIIPSLLEKRQEARAIDERSIGNIITQAKQLTQDQVNAIGSVRPRSSWALRRLRT